MAEKDKTQRLPRFQRLKSMMNLLHEGNSENNGTRENNDKLPACNPPYISRRQRSLERLKSVFRLSGEQDKKPHGTKQAVLATADAQKENTCLRLREQSGAALLVKETHPIDTLSPFEIPVPAKSADLRGRSRLSMRVLGKDPPSTSRAALQSPPTLKTRLKSTQSGNNAVAFLSCNHQTTHAKTVPQNGPAMKFSFEQDPPEHKKASNATGTRRRLATPYRSQKLKDQKHGLVGPARQVLGLVASGFARLRSGSGRREGKGEWEDGAFKGSVLKPDVPFFDLHQHQRDNSNLTAQLAGGAGAAAPAGRVARAEDAEAPRGRSQCRGASVRRVSARVFRNQGAEELGGEGGVFDPSAQQPPPPARRGVQQVPAPPLARPPASAVSSGGGNRSSSSTAGQEKQGTRRERKSRRRPAPDVQGGSPQKMEGTSDTGATEIITVFEEMTTTTITRTSVYRTSSSNTWTSGQGTADPCKSPDVHTHVQASEASPEESFGKGEAFLRHPDFGESEKVGLLAVAGSKATSTAQESEECLPSVGADTVWHAGGCRLDAKPDFGMAKIATDADARCGKSVAPLQGLTEEIRPIDKTENCWENENKLDAKSAEQTATAKMAESDCKDVSVQANQITVGLKNTVANDEALQAAKALADKFAAAESFQSPVRAEAEEPHATEGGGASKSDKEAAANLGIENLTHGNAGSSFWELCKEVPDAQQEADSTENAEFAALAADGLNAPAAANPAEGVEVFGSVLEAAKVADHGKEKYLKTAAENTRVQATKIFLPCVDRIAASNESNAEAGLVLPAPLNPPASACGDLAEQAWADPPAAASRSDKHVRVAVTPGRMCGEPAAVQVLMAVRARAPLQRHAVMLQHQREAETRRQLAMEREAEALYWRNTAQVLQTSLGPATEGGDAEPVGAAEAAGAAFTVGGASGSSTVSSGKPAVLHTSKALEFHLTETSPGVRSEEISLAVSPSARSCFHVFRNSLHSPSTQNTLQEHSQGTPVAVSGLDTIKPAQTALSDLLVDKFLAQAGRLEKSPRPFGDEKGAGIGALQDEAGCRGEQDQLSAGEEPGANVRLKQPQQAAPAGAGESLQQIALEAGRAAAADASVAAAGDATFAGYGISDESDTHLCGNKMSAGFSPSQTFLAGSKAERPPTALLASVKSFFPAKSLQTRDALLKTLRPVCTCLDVSQNLAPQNFFKPDSFRKLEERSSEERLGKERLGEERSGEAGGAGLVCGSGSEPSTEPLEAKLGQVLRAKPRKKVTWGALEIIEEETALSSCSSGAAESFEWSVAGAGDGGAQEGGDDLASPVSPLSVAVPACVCARLSVIQSLVPRIQEMSLQPGCCLGQSAERVGCCVASLCGRAGTPLSTLSADEGGSTTCSRDSSCDFSPAHKLVGN